MTTPLIELDNVDVALDGQKVLRAITWQLRPRQHWAILGPNGSGKTTLLKLIRGDLWLAPDSPGKRVYAFDGSPQSNAVGIRERVALVSPELQQRYLQQEWTLTAQHVIHTGFFNTDYLYQKLTARQKALAASIIERLGVEPLLPRNVQELSAGELRRVLIARALAGSPRVLICDEICDGLDARARAQVLAALQRVAHNGTPLLFTTHRREEIFPAITHALVLAEGRIAWQGARWAHQDWTSLPLPKRPSAKRTARPGASAATVGPRTAPVRSAPQADKASPSRSAPRRSELLRAGTACAPVEGGAVKCEHGEVLINIQRADVYLGRTKVLRNITWQLRPGENWAILGRNGSGKSTFLKLIAGDLHPAAGGESRRFPFARHSTVWELRKKIGLVSAELQWRYGEAMTGSDVIASGFFSSIGLIDTVTARQRRRVRALERGLSLQALARKNVLRMSYGEFRQILLARSLVHDPPLLIFDEPFDGLDAAAKADMTATLERAARRGTQLILVTHHLGELPACMTHALVLEDGRMVRQGRVAEVISG